MLPPEIEKSFWNIQLHFGVSEKLFLKQSPEIERIQNTKNLDRIDMPTLKTDPESIKETKEFVISKINDKKAKKINDLEKLFTESRFKRFLINYWRIFFPELKRPFSETIDIYLEWSGFE